jgi:molybdopterin converting factor small subunit
MPRVIVRYFASLRETRGIDSEEIEFQTGQTIGELYDQLFPAGPEGQLPVGYAKNERMTCRTERLSDGDEVAFLPPLGGG